MPELADLSRLDAELRVLDDRVITAETEQSDAVRAQAKADTDVELVRQRATRDQQRLDAGAVSNSKELENLQHEIASLARRQGALEDIELEIMERLEEIDARLRQLNADRDALRGQRLEAEARRDAAFAEIDGEASTSRTFRDTLATQIAPALVTLYEKVRAQQGGLAAAALKHRRCQGCQLELNTAEINTLRDAAEDEVLRCEECQRILIRTPESGL